MNHNLLKKCKKNGLKIYEFRTHQGTRGSGGPWVCLFFYFLFYFCRWDWVLMEERVVLGFDYFFLGLCQRRGRISSYCRGGVGSPTGLIIGFCFF